MSPLLTAVLVVTLTASFLIVVRYGAPLALRAFFPRLGMASVSPRSIRGLVWHGRTFILSIERIGFGLHRPSLERSSWISVQVEKFELQFMGFSKDRAGGSLTNGTSQGNFSSYQDKSRTVQSPQPSRTLAQILDVNENCAPSGPFLDWVLPSSFIQSVDRQLRPVLRVLLVHVLRTLFRALPSVTQIVQFEMDSATVTAASLGGAGLTLADVRVNGSMEFDHMDDIVEEDAELSSADGKSGASRLRARMQSGMTRLWNRAWGNTRGVASLKLEVGNAKVFCGSPFSGSSQQWYNPTPGYSPPVSVSSEDRSSARTASAADVIYNLVPPDTVFLTRDVLTIRISVRVEPRKGLVGSGSLNIDMDVPPSYASLGAVRKLGVISKLEEVSERNQGPPSVSPGDSEEADARVWSSSFRRSIAPGFVARRRFIGKEPRTQNVQVESVVRALTRIIAKASFRLDALDVCLDLPSPDGKSLYVATQALVVDVQPSDPVSNKLHSDWLGNRNDLPGSAALIISMSVDSIVLRSLDIGSLARKDVLAVGGIDLSILSTGIPSLSSDDEIFGWDENTFICITDATVRYVDIRDHIHALQQMARTVSVLQESPAPSRSKWLRGLPRLVLSLQIQRIVLQLGLSSPSQSRPVYLDIDNEGITLHAVASYTDLCSSSSRFEPGKAYWGGEDGRRLRSDQDQYSLRYDFSIEGSVTPVSGELRFPGSERMEQGQMQSTSVFKIGTCDFGIVGHGLGMSSLDHHCKGGMIDSQSAMADIRMIVTRAVLEVWDPIMLAALHNVFDVTPSPSVATEVEQRSSDTSIWSRLPSGICFYTSVLSCMVLIGGEDSTSSLARGVVSRLGFVIQYCSYHSLEHTIRTKKHLSLSLARQRLSLPEDLSVEAAAVANDVGNGDEMAALTSLTAWDASMMCYLNANEGCDYRSSFALPIEHLGRKENVILSLPRLVGRVLLRSHGPIGKIATKRSCDVMFEAPALSAHIRLLHIFCILLAMRSVQSLLPVRFHRRTRAIEPIPTTVRIVANIETLDIFCSMPLKSRLHVRISRFLGERGSAPSHTLRWMNAYVWSPSPTVDGAWEELLRLREWTISMAMPSQAGLVAAGKGVRIHIPYKFVLYELVSDIVVLVKGSQHLTRCIHDRVFTSPSFPGAKPSRVMPHVELHVDTFTMEAVDAPFESHLNLIWRTGYQEQLARLDRELAFKAKVEAIGDGHSSRPSSRSSHQLAMGWNFSGKHTVSVSEAYQRLQMYNAQSWITKHRDAKAEQERKEDFVHRTIHGTPFHFGPYRLPITIHTPDKAAPLLRIMFTGVDLILSRPSFQVSELSHFLNDLGRGVPLDQKYSLLLPMGVSWKMVSARITLRDYPLPLFHVPGKAASGEPAWSLSSDFVIAEQVGPPTSVQWVKTEIIPDDTGMDGAPGLHFHIPKTCMPVKTFAEPQIQIYTSSATEFAWGISYNPAIQDVMRVIDSITSPPRDPSPPMGFWDKLRLVLHWRVKWDFTKAGVHFHMKGSRDPYNVSDVGAGFALCWEGCPSIRIGYSDKDMEIIQVQSERMSFVIPHLEGLNEKMASPVEPTVSQDPAETPRRFRKVCAKFTNGVRWGIGFKVERTCRPEDCNRCKGSIFHRQCRFFEFRPHYTVELKSHPRVSRPPEEWPDSYAGFRSDFLHMSLSLTSPTRDIHTANVYTTDTATLPGYNSFHLTPKGFAHFWSWWRLFEGTMSIPIRQGKLFPSVRPPSPKFGRHLATIKYRVSLAPLVISHGYRQDAMAQWAKGITGAVGIKAMIDGFRADMHQRLQEMVTYHEKLQKTKRTVRKVFCAADVTLLDVDLRTLSAVFAEPEKTAVAEQVDSDSDDMRSQCTVPCDDVAAGWFDLDDFVDADWSPSDQKPKVKLLSAGACPRFSFFKRANASALNRRASDQLISTDVEVTKFGDEDTHICFAGREDDAYQVQIDLASHRVAELESELEEVARNNPTHRHPQHQEQARKRDFADEPNREADLMMKVRLLREYISRLQSAEGHLNANGGLNHFFFEYEPLQPQGSGADVASEDWMNFDNVYEAHFPTIFLNNDTRNVLLDYYYSSRMQRGLEYHMSERSVKFIRDHAKPVHPRQPERQPTRVASQPAPAVASQSSRAHGAAQGLFRLFTHDGRSSEEGAKDNGQYVDDVFEEPQSGWSDDVAVRKGHIARLIKPQIVLQSDINQDSTIVVAVRSVYIRNFSVLDKEHLDDPVNGHIMQRNYVSLNGLQMFCPSQQYVASSIEANIFVPLEVLLDIRCETTDFDRLVPYTDARIHYDKFNQLRLRKSMRTGSLDLLSRRNEHLKHNMDRMVISIPAFSVSADARHFSAMYNIATDLLLYRDPTQKARSQKLETFLYSYDFTDLSSAAEVISGIQTRMRQLRQLERDSALRIAHNIALRDQLAIRAEMQSLAEELSFIFDAIRLKQDKTGSRQDQEESSALRVEVYVSEISWMMLDPSHALLAKLSAKGISFSWLSRKDGSASSKLDVDDLQALNSTPEALFPEMLVKYEKASNHPMVKMSKFARASWSVLAPVSGIPIIESFELELHPVRLQIERRVGRQIMDYVFARRRKEMLPAQPVEPLALGSFNGTAGVPIPTGLGIPIRQSPAASRQPEHLADDVVRGQRPRLLIGRASSMTDVPASVGLIRQRGLPRVASSEVLVSRVGNRENKDALEMRSRAAQNRTFLEINVASSVFVMSYKGDKAKSITDLYDFKFQVPSFQYRNQTWSFEDLVQQLKKDIIRSAWQQKGALFREVVTKRRRPRHLLQAQTRQDSISSQQSQSSSEVGPSDPDIKRRSRTRRLWPLRKKGEKPYGSHDHEVASSAPWESYTATSTVPARPYETEGSQTTAGWTEESEQVTQSSSPDLLESESGESSVDFPTDPYAEYSGEEDVHIRNRLRPSRRRTVSDYPELYGL